MGYIPEHIVQQIRESADILEVVSDFVSLQKKGHNWWALSPFTDEKTPSFSVNPSKNIFKCFSTGIGGDAVKFMMEVEKLSYPNALRYLAQKYHIEIEEDEISDEERAKQTEKESLFIIMDHARKYFENLLHHDVEEGYPLGMSYFKERGFSIEIIKKFSLGYSKKEWQHLEKEFLSKSFSKKSLELAGLTIRNQEKNTTYDRFRGRVMFPIRSVAGKTIAFGARTLKKDEKPKYLNSPQTPIYNKSDILYGIFEAKNHIRKEDNCYLTEGYTDVISLHQHGIPNVVASSGTSLTENQIRLVRRFTENITVLYDGDHAGIKASLRGIDMILAKGMNVKIVLFPDGEDPDSYAQKLGEYAFSAFLKQNKQDFITFKTEFYLKDAQNDPLKRAEAIQEIVTSISKIPNHIKRSVFFKQCAQLLDIQESILINECNRILLRKNRQRANQQQHQIISNRQDNPSTNSKVEYHSQQNVKQKEDDFLPPDVSIPPIKSPNQDEYIHQKNNILESKSTQYTILVWEKDLIRILLMYGQEMLEGSMKVWEYLLRETEELTFHTPVYCQILEIYKTKLADGLEIDAEYLIRTGSMDIVENVSNMVTEQFTVSEHWQKRYEIHIPDEKQGLGEKLFKAIVKRKLLLINELMQELNKKLKQKQTEEQKRQIIDTQMELLVTQRSLIQNYTTPTK